MKPLKKKKFLTLVFFACTLMQYIYAIQIVPPPPPPGGDELWSGTIGVSDDLVCRECVGGTEVGQYCFGGDWVVVNCEETDFELDDLRRMLWWGWDLPGGTGIETFEDLMELIEDGVITLETDEWQFIINFADGLDDEDDLDRVCASKPPGVSNPACVPIPLWAFLLLLFSSVFIWYKNYYQPQLLDKV